MTTAHTQYTPELRCELRVLNSAASEGSRQLRLEQQRLYRKARKAKARRKNSDTFTRYGDALSKHRAEWRVEARYLHLCRAYLSGKTYLEVEQSVRDGNDVNVFRLNTTIMSSADIFVDMVDLDEWLNG